MWHVGRMKKSKSKPDANEAAYSIIQQVIAKTDPAAQPAKNPAAVALGRLGGLKGGKARAQKLSKKERKNIAKKAAAARWSKSP